MSNGRVLGLPVQDERADTANTLHVLPEGAVTQDPFPHSVIPGFLDDGDARYLSRALDLVKGYGSEKNVAHTQGKRAYTPFDSNFSREVWEIVAQLMRPAMLERLGHITGIYGLVPDPYFQGAGFHVIAPGGFLKIHADYSYHVPLKLYRRVNLLIYLNQDWHPEWGGDLELWARDMSKCVVRVSPTFNTAVVFNTDETSYHGHPEPLKCPVGECRKSLALYYYAAEPAPKTRKRTHTKYVERASDNFLSWKTRVTRWVTG